MEEFKIGSLIKDTQGRGIYQIIGYGNCDRRKTIIFIDIVTKQKHVMELGAILQYNWYQVIK